MLPARDPRRPAPSDGADDRAPEERTHRGALLRPTGASKSEDLHHLLKMISSSSDARRELVEDIRRQVASGAYVTEDKLNLAIYRLLKDILN